MSDCNPNKRMSEASPADGTEPKKQKTLAPVTDAAAETTDTAAETTDTAAETTDTAAETTDAAASSSSSTAAATANATQPQPQEQKEQKDTGARLAEVTGKPIAELTAAHAGVSEDELAKVEEACGIKLPDTLRKIFQITSQAYFSLSCLPTTQKNSWAGNHVPFNGIELDNISSTAEMADEWGFPGVLAGKLALLDGDGHTWLALDYRASDTEPSVVFLEQRYANGDEEWGIVPIADSFDAAWAAVCAESDLQGEP